MGNDDPPEWWIMHFEVCDELWSGNSEPPLMSTSTLNQFTHVIFEVHIHFLKSPCRN